MAMTREQVLAQMEASFEQMPEEIRTKVLFSEQGRDWTPTMLLEEVRNDTEYGKLYAQSWAQQQEDRAALLKLLSLLGGGGDEEMMTCGDPDCPNCHGEVRPLGLPPTGSDTIH